MKKNILIPLVIAGVIVLAAGAAAGGFFYGKSYESNRASNIQNNFLRERGIQGFNPNDLPGLSQNSGQPGAVFQGGGFGRGESGEVKSLDGNTLTLAVGESETKVTLSDTTTVQKSTSGTIADITAGQQVMVIGERDADGNMTASQITILNTSLSQP